jgi:phosphatidylglycerol:prolipoprotein diacylglycerol transferase
VTDIESPYPNEGFAPGGRDLVGVLVAPVNWLTDRVVVFQFRDYIFVSYGLAGGIGALVGLWLAAVILLGQGLGQGEFVILSLVGSVGVVVGSKLAAMALDYREMLERPLAVLRRPTFVSWGGIVGVAITLIVFSLVSDFRLLLLVDGCARAGTLGHAIGRVGCIAYGCCYGRPTESRFSVTYGNPHAKAVRSGGLSGVPLHPAALYEMGLVLALFALLNGLAIAEVPQGVPAMLYMLIYGSGRFAIEFFRDNGGRKVWGPLAVNHVLSLGWAALGAIFLAVVLIFQAGAVDYSLETGLRESLPLLPLVIVAGLVIFLGFSVHRGKIGEW